MTASSLPHAASIPCPRPDHVRPEYRARPSQPHEVLGAAQNKPSEYQHPVCTTTRPHTAYSPMPRWLPPHTPMWRSEGGACCSVAAVKTRRRRARTLGRVRGAGTGMEPSLGHDRCGSLQWLPARVMSDLPRWHTQRYGRCQNSRYLSGQRRGVPLSRTTCSASRSPSSIPSHRPPVPRY